MRRAHHSALRTQRGRQPSLATGSRGIRDRTRQGAPCTSTLPIRPGSAAGLHNIPNLDAASPLVQFRAAGRGRGDFHLLPVRWTTGTVLLVKVHSDALLVAERLVERGRVRSADLSTELKWGAPRLNAACEYLAEGGFVLVSWERPSHPYSFLELHATPRTHQFIRDGTKS